MTQNFSLHTHTTFSDGHNSVEEMVVQAINLGWSAIGISDHLIVHPMYTLNSGCTFESFDKALAYARHHVEEIRRIGKLYPQIKVYAGFEVDYFPLDGWLDAFRQFKRQIDLDYYISGNHRVTDKTGQQIYDIYSYRHYGLTAEQTKEYFHNHFCNLRNAVLSGEFTFLAHLDFARWSRVITEKDFRTEIRDIIAALKQTGMPTEINTKGRNSIGDFYPAQWALSEIVAAGIPLVISDDAHYVSQLGQYFEDAENILAELNHHNRWSL